MGWTETTITNYLISMRQPMPLPMPSPSSPSSPLSPYRVRSRVQSVPLLLPAVPGTTHRSVGHTTRLDRPVTDGDEIYYVVIAYIWECANIKNRMTHFLTFLYPINFCSKPSNGTVLLSQARLSKVTTCVLMSHSKTALSSTQS